MSSHARKLAQMKHPPRRLLAEMGRHAVDGNYCNLLYSDLRDRENRNPSGGTDVVCNKRNGERRRGRSQFATLRKLQALVLGETARRRRLPVLRGLAGNRPPVARRVATAL